MLISRTRFVFFGMAAAGVLAAIACGSSDDTGNGDDDGGVNGTDAGDATTGDGASVGPDGGVSDGGGDGATAFRCAPAAVLVDTSHPDIVIGTGTPASCTAAALTSAVAHGGIITFSCGSSPVTITLSNELDNTIDPDLDGGRALVIDGNDLVTLDGNGANIIFSLSNIDSGIAAPITLQRITLARSSGAAVQSSGSVTAIDCTFAANNGAIKVNPGVDVRIEGSAFVDGGATLGAGITVGRDTLTITNSRFVGNVATALGGAIYSKDSTVSLCGDIFRSNSATPFAGGACEFSSETIPYPVVTIDRSVFDQNVCFSASGCSGGAIDLQGYAATITNSTFSSNAAIQTSSNAGSSRGGAISSTAGSIDFENLTVFGNSAGGSDGGVSGSDGAGIYAGKVGVIRHCTIAGNHGLGVVGPFSMDAGVVLDHSLVIDNRGPTVPPLNCNPFTIADGPRNLVFPALPVDAGHECTASEIVADPKLGPLQDNGGPTLTMQPASGSPAETSAACAGTDQRGVPRSKCTSGAVEGL